MRDVEIGGGIKFKIILGLSVQPAAETMEETFTKITGK